MKKKVSYNDLALIAGNISTLYEDGIQLLNIFTLLDELPLRKEFIKGNGRGYKRRWKFKVCF